MCSHVVSRKLDKLLTDCRVYVIVWNPQKPSSCLGEVMKTSKDTREILNIKLFSVETSLHCCKEGGIAEW